MAVGKQTDCWNSSYTELHPEEKEKVELIRDGM